jgi:hypothetical protein
VNRVSLRPPFGDHRFEVVEYRNPVPVGSSIEPSLQAAHPAEDTVEGNWPRPLRTPSLGSDQDATPCLSHAEHQSILTAGRGWVCLPRSSVSGACCRRSSHRSAVQAVESAAAPTRWDPLRWVVGLSVALPRPTASLETPSHVLLGAPSNGSMPRRAQPSGTGQTPPPVPSDGPKQGLAGEPLTHVSQKPFRERSFLTPASGR